MKLILIGKSASGKDTLRHALEQRGLVFAKTYTTRKARDNEPSDTYIYLDDDQMDEKWDDLVAKSEFEFGSKRYGVDPDDLAQADAVILTPSGAREVCHAIGHRMSCVIVYMTADDDTRIQVSAARGASPEEIKTRDEQDKKTFEDIETLFDDEYVAGVIRLENTYEARDLELMAEAIMRARRQHDRVEHIIDELIEADAIENIDGAVFVTTDDGSSIEVTSDVLASMYLARSDELLDLLLTRLGLEI